MTGWLRRSFITGFFVTVPLFITVAAFVWIFTVVDGLTTPLYDRVIGFRVPGLGVASTGFVILAVGAVASNVIGKRLLARTESVLLRVPLFRTIYAPVRQLVAAFSPDNEYGFKQVVLLEGRYGYMLGFLTKEFEVDKGKGPEPFIAAYVPTNHLYIGDVLVCERSRATFPAITVEEGVRIFLTGGVALPDRLFGGSGGDPSRDFRV
jgi:uncharacterized membrane protein